MDFIMSMEFVEQLLTEKNQTECKGDGTFIPLGKKRCNQCKEILPLSEFYKRSKSFDGRAYKCKKCSKRGNLESAVHGYARKDGREK